MIKVFLDARKCSSLLGVRATSYLTCSGACAREAERRSSTVNCRLVVLDNEMRPVSRAVHSMRSCMGVEHHLMIIFFSKMNKNAHRFQEVIFCMSSGRIHDSIR